VGREMGARIEKILCTVLHEAHRRQVEETMEPSPRDQRDSTSRRLVFRSNPFPYSGRMFHAS
jgi:hypothetical protein